MKNIAIIPMRKGSKSIPHKNRKKLLGRPLFAYVLTEAIFSKLTDIYIFTDDELIVEFVKNEYKWSSKVKCIQRGEENANDTASTEAAMLEFVSKIDNNYDTISLVQATSPVLTRAYIDKSLSKIIDENYDSTVSVVEYKRFFWNEKGDSINYDYNNRPRRQDFKGTLVENGAIYTTTKKQFEKSNNRLGGTIATVIMPEDSLIEIDEPSDWGIVELLLKKQLNSKKDKPKTIKAVVFDVDGVFTTGEVTNNSNGEFSKTFSMRDGMGIELLKESGVKVYIMTSENSLIVKTRMEKLKADGLFLGVKDKYSRLEQLLVNNKIGRSNIAYIGDDINDLANICSVGWSFCPNNAELELKQEADIILNSKGGEMAVRELVNIVLKINKRFE